LDGAEAAGELNQAPTGVAHLLGARVYDRNGRKPGHVHELRRHREEDGTVVEHRYERIVVRG
jgi:hypothetical protein